MEPRSRVANLEGAERIFEDMFEQQDSLNSSHSEATGRMCAPANWLAADLSMQPVVLPCQQRQQLHTAVGANQHQQPRLTKAILDQHEKIALTSLLLMQQQSTSTKVCHPCAYCHMYCYTYSTGGGGYG